MNDVTTTKRIAKNTLMLYFRQILIMLVSLYTVRVVLNVLGAEDYGIYNVVAGVVTMFSFLANTMATASQRYFSYNIGKNDFESLRVTFNVTFQIYLLMGIIVVFLGETLGLWFVNNKLVIPAERLVAANIIYQAALVSFLLTLITAPFMACLISHENMNVYAYVSIVEVSLKLGIVFILKILSYDKLILYGILLCLVALINTSIYRFYCHKHYRESKIMLIGNKALFKELISYSGWNLFGASVSVIKNQVMNILLNLFFGPIVNAARGVAGQVSNSVASFANNFGTAIKPQIIKNYAADKKDESYNLVFYGSKLSFFLMWIFTLPLLLEMDFVLKVWLKNPPVHAVFFTQLVLIDVLIDSINHQVMTIIQANGKIKLYQVVVGGIQLLNLPVSYVILKLGNPAYMVFFVSIMLTLMAAIARLIVAKKLTNLSIVMFLKKTLLPSLLVVLFSSIVPYYVSKIISGEIVEFFVVCICSVITNLLAIIIFGFSKDERIKAVKFFCSKFKRKH